MMPFLSSSVLSHIPMLSSQADLASKMPGHVEYALKVGVRISQVRGYCQSTVAVLGH